MLIPDRNGAVSGTDYRYGFQAQECDQEMSNSASYYAFEYRTNDARIGRFLSIDPLTHEYPFYSPYQFSGNRLIDMKELEGLEPEKAGKEIGEKTEYEGSTWTWGNNQSGDQEWIREEQYSLPEHIVTPKPTCLSCELRQLGYKFNPLLWLGGIPEPDARGYHSTDAPASDSPMPTGILDWGGNIPAEGGKSWGKDDYDNQESDKSENKNTTKKPLQGGGRDTIYTTNMYGQPIYRVDTIFYDGKGNIIRVPLLFGDPSDKSQIHVPLGSPRNKTK